MFYAVVKPENVNSRLAAVGGKVVVHLPNYMEIFSTKPTIKDEAFQVFSIDPLPSEINKVNEGDRERFYLWTGDKSSRGRPQDLVSVPIYPAGVSPAEAIPFSDYPDLIKLAAVVLNVSDQALIDVPGIGPALTKQLKEWAKGAIDKYMGNQNG